MGVSWGFSRRVVETGDSNLLGYSSKKPPSNPHGGFLMTLWICFFNVTQKSMFSQSICLLRKNGLGWPSEFINGSNWVKLASKRVQIRIQPYNVLNKPKLNPTRRVGPSGTKIVLGWPSRSEFGSGWSGSFGCTISNHWNNPAKKVYHMYFLC